MEQSLQRLERVLDDDREPEPTPAPRSDGADSEDLRGESD
jgi:hypothetical protein